MTVPASGNPFERFDGILVINLDRHVDRWAQFIRQAEIYGFKHLVTRFPAISHPDGAYGCSLSHRECLRLAKRNGWKNVLILEDDVKFLYSPRYTYNALNRALDKLESLPEGWDLFYLGMSMRERLIDPSVKPVPGDAFLSSGEWYGRFALAVNSRSYDILDSIPEQPVFKKEDRGDVVLRHSRASKYVMWPAAASVYPSESLTNPGLANVDKFLETRYSNFGMTDPEPVKTAVSAGKDFNIAVVMSSYDRYSGMISIINQLNGQHTGYTWKLFIMDDGSQQPGYSGLSSAFPEAVILRNTVNNGKKRYWKTMSDLFKATSRYSYDVLIQIDDDFVLCNGFLNGIMELFKTKGCEVLHYHTNTEGSGPRQWGFTNWIDGGSAFTQAFMEKINYSIKEIPLSRWDKNPDYSSGVWQTLSSCIDKWGIPVYKPEYTMAVHRGNVDSKMNNELRKVQKIHSGY